MAPSTHEHSPRPDTPALTSTDDVRSAAPLRHLQRVTLDAPLRLALGGELPKATVAFETWGELNAARDNAVLVCHAISGDSHCAKHDEDPDDDPGWWDALIGPGKPIDTDTHFVVCPNVLGGCRGTTGPGSVNPQTGRVYGPDFPPITVDDIVDLHAALLERLGIDTLKAVVGGSLGGMQALSLATRHPNRVEHCVAVATAPRLSSQALAFDVVARNAIQRDPHFHDGRYYDYPVHPHTGLAIARMLGHITYLSSEAMDAKFDPDRHRPRDLETAFEARFSVGSYLAHQGQKFVERFDANTYLALSMAMDLFDLGRTHEQRVATLGRADCEFLVVAFSSDWLFPTAQSRDIVQALTEQGTPVTYCEITTPAGHDAFLLDREIERYGPVIAARLGDVDQTPVKHRTDDDLILDLIPEGASVLDLGCGDGELLARLRQRDPPVRGSANAAERAAATPPVHLCGVEVNQDRIIATARRGLHVIDYDLNVGLPGFEPGSFDFVVLSATLQTLEDVEMVITEMVRVGRKAIVSFPNFAHKPMRDYFQREGRSPKGLGSFQHEWYNTPNRRFPSIADFEDFIVAKGLTKHVAVYMDTTALRRIPEDDNPNLHADTAVYVISA